MTNSVLIKLKLVKSHQKNNRIQSVWITFFDLTHFVLTASKPILSHLNQHFGSVTNQEILHLNCQRRTVNYLDACFMLTNTI